MEWEAQLLEARVREQQEARWAAAEGYSAELEELEADFRGMVRRLRQSPTSSARDSGMGGSRRTLATGGGPMRDNTPKKLGVGYKTQWLPPSFKVDSGRALDV